MFTLKSEIQFDSAHYLKGYDGKCKNIHGHRYRLIVKVMSETLYEAGPKRGMVEDFGDIKTKLKKIEEMFDHKLIVEDDEDGRRLVESLSQIGQEFEVIYVPYRPTAEEMSRHIYHLLKEMGLNVSEVELYETPTNSCTYRETHKEVSSCLMS